MFTAGKDDTRAHAEHNSQQPEPSNPHLRSLRLCDPRTKIVTGARTRQTCTVPNHSDHWTTRLRVRFGPSDVAYGFSRTAFTGTDVASGFTRTAFASTSRQWAARRC